ncbi:DinB family protein [Sphingobacterium rhinopitheci]|uniref:DinB family protein n=1 Tax=Sphingobacterium rhinopitheci TaxID=2781960 RepID=UPI001F5173D3|nr:DinB family protein [Sphingobacterium rhinopitheci]MCI0921030.1 DinB family protein [Sphingobacterium rhinopitheci]
MNPLKSDEYPAIFEPYIETIIGDAREELETQLITFPIFIESIPETKGSYTYADGKWTIKEILCHIIDTERIMGYRALRFARNDMTALSPFEQDEFVANGRHNERSLESITQEFIHLRKSNILFFDSLNEVELSRKGMASDRLISVRALFYIIAGHLNHHRIILQERYLKE